MKYVTGDLISEGISNLDPFSKNVLIHGLLYTYMDGTAVKFFLLIFPHEAGTWNPNYAPGVDFLDHNFLSSKNSG